MKTMFVALTLALISISSIAKAEVTTGKAFWSTPGGSVLACKVMAVKDNQAIIDVGGLFKSDFRTVPCTSVMMKSDIEKALANDQNAGG